MAETSDLILRISIETRKNAYNDSRYGTVTARVERWRGEESTYDEEVSRYCYNHPFAGLCITGRYADFHHDEPSYNYEVGFEVSSLLTYQVMEQHRAALTKLNTAMRKIAAKFGEAKTIGQYISYVMAATGIPRACWKLPEGRRRHWMVTEDPSMAVAYVDGTIATFHMERREREREQAQASA